MGTNELKEVLFARGHKNISASHETTLEITKETNVSERGNCIIAVSANKSLDDLESRFKDNLRKKSSRVKILIRAGDIVETVNASGNPSLMLTHPTDIVVRKSRYICNRTLAIGADKASSDLSRALVEKIRTPDQKIEITLTVAVSDSESASIP